MTAIAQGSNGCAELRNSDVSGSGGGGCGTSGDGNDALDATGCPFAGTAIDPSVSPGAGSHMAPNGCGCGPSAGSVGGGFFALA